MVVFHHLVYWIHSTTDVSSWLQSGSGQQVRRKKNDEKTRSNLGYVLAPSKKGHPKNMVHFPDKTCHTRECIKGPAYQRFLSIWYERSELRMVPFSKTVGYVWKSFVRAQVSKQLAEPHEFSPHGPLSFMLTGSFLFCLVFLYPFLYTILSQIKMFTVMSGVITSHQLKQLFSYFV